MSSLKTGHERFLARTMVHALTDGWRTPADFLRHFPPLELMQSLEAAPDLRAQLLVEAAGVHEKIARKKSIDSAAEDLRIALDEGITDPAAVLALIPPDDRVRFLDAHALWKFLVEDEFWSPLNAEANRERAVGRMTFTLETAIEENLLSLMDLTDGIGFETIVQKLPQKEAQKLLIHAFRLGRDKKPLDEAEMLDVIPLRALVSYVPLEQVYESVVVQRVAGPAGFTQAGAKPKKVVSAPPQPAVAEKKQSAPAPKPLVQPEPERESIPDRSSVDDVDRLVEGSRASAEEDARRKVTDKLSAINRLPPKHESLSTPILLSIESMYSELLTASTDEARELCIRDSFPNESQLSTALLALIELLDPSIDVNDPVIRDADLDSLIKVVLFEERHRFEQAHPSLRPPSPSAAPLPPPGSARPRNSVPPPLPRGSGGPPPLPNAEKRAR